MDNGDGWIAEGRVRPHIAIKTLHQVGAHIENIRVNPGCITRTPFGINCRQKLLHKTLIASAVIQPDDIGKCRVLPAKFMQMRGFV